MIIVPFEPWHVNVMNFRSYEKECLGLGDTRRHIEARYVDDSYAFSMVSNGKIIFSGGIMPKWKGVAEAWVILTEEFESFNVFTCVRQIRAFLDLAEKQFNLHRIQGAVDKTNLKAIRLIEFLGFKRECEMRGYGTPGSVYLQYARTKDQ